MDMSIQGSTALCQLDGLVLHPEIKTNLGQVAVDRSLGLCRMPLCLASYDSLLSIRSLQ